MNNKRKKTKQKVLMVIDYPARVNFFLKFLAPLEGHNYEAHFLTNDLYDYLRLILKRETAFIIEKKRESIIEITQKFPQICLKQKAINEIYNAATYTVDKLHRKNKYDLIFFFNGSDVVSQAVSKYCFQEKILTMYFEIGNIPNKIFADPKGVNAASALYRNIEILDLYPESKVKYSEWKREYADIKVKEQMVPQATIKKAGVVEKIARRILCLLKTCMLKVPNYSDGIVGAELKQKIFGVREKYKYAKRELIKGKYIFFPLQVSSDTQLLYNSDYDNLAALQIAIKMAYEKDMLLIVKPHPCEHNKEIIHEINIAQARHRFLLTDLNAFQLIRQAEEIVTINSTVGLEAMILGKKVTFLGRSIYSQLDEARLEKYILEYLIEGNYFDSAPLSLGSMEKIIKRAASRRCY
ncbi:MAG: hypothetical protein ACOY3K_03245 [Candidatus Omnitrophota bacterium]